MKNRLSRLAIVEQRTVAVPAGLALEEDEVEAAAHREVRDEHVQDGNDGDEQAARGDVPDRVVHPSDLRGGWSYRQSCADSEGPDKEPSMTRRLARSRERFHDPHLRHTLAAGRRARNRSSSVGELADVVGGELGGAASKRRPARIRACCCWRSSRVSGRICASAAMTRVRGRRHLDEVAEVHQVALAEAHGVERGHGVALVPLGEPFASETGHHDDADLDAGRLDGPDRLRGVRGGPGLADEGEQRVVAGFEADVHPAQAEMAEQPVLGRRLPRAR